MFAIYDIQGRRFRDTMDKMHKVYKLQPGHGMNMHADTNQDETVLIPDITGNALPISEKAKQAYREAVQHHDRTPVLHAYQIMSRPVVTLRAELDVATGLRLFQTQRYHQFPVLFGSKGIVGMLSELDLLRFLIHKKSDLRSVNKIPLADTLAGEVITTDPISDVRRVARVLQEYHLSALPVVDEHNTLVGLISRSDILNAVSREPPLSLWT